MTALFSVYSLPIMSITFTEHPDKQETNLFFRFINLIGTNGTAFVSIFCGTTDETVTNI